MRRSKLERFKNIRGVRVQLAPYVGVGYITPVVGSVKIFSTNGATAVSKLKAVVICQGLKDRPSCACDSASAVRLPLRSQKGGISGIHMWKMRNIIDVK